MLTLPAWAHTIVGPWQAASTSGRAVGVHAALAVGGHDPQPAAAEAEEAQGGVDGDVALGPDHDLDRRGAEQAVALHVPAGGGEHVRGGPRPGR